MKASSLLITCLICLIAAVNFIFCQDAGEILHKAKQNALSVKTCSFNLISKYQSTSSGTNTEKSIRLLIKRDSSIFKLKSFEVQGNDSIYHYFDGKNYTYIHVKNKHGFIYDSAQHVSGWAKNILLSSKADFFISRDSNDIKIEKNEKIALDDKIYNIDNFECYKISIVYKKSEDKESKIEDDGYLEKIKEFYISISEYQLKKYYSKIFLNDSNYSVEEKLFSDIISDNIDDSIFKYTPQPGFKIEPYIPEPVPELLKAGMDAPDWTLVNEKGEQINLKSLRGKVVVMDFWATWCKWCRKAMPSIQKIHERYTGKAISIFGISCMEHKKADPAKYMKINNFTYGLLLNGDSVASDYHVTGGVGIPVLYIIDKNGKIKHVELGYEDDIYDKLTKILDKIVD